MELPSTETLVALGGAGTLFWKFFEGLIARTVKTFDEKVAKQDKLIDELLTSKITQASDLQQVRNTLGSFVEKISEVRVLISEMKNTGEVTRTQQANFYRDELAKLERSMRNELQKIEASVILAPTREKQARSR